MHDCGKRFRTKLFDVDIKSSVLKKKIKTGITEMFEKSVGHYKISGGILGLKFIHWLCYILMADAIS